MLPTEDAVWVGEELARRFGLPYWQFAVTATDANRFALRLARAHHRTAEDPGLQLVLSRHGGRDLRHAPGRPHGGARRQPGPAGRSRRSRRAWSSSTTSPALEAALAHGRRRLRARRAGAHQRRHRAPRARASTRRSASSPAGPGTLLIIDETHTICAGPGGYTRAHGLEPDMLTLGKPVGGGVPGAVYGFSDGGRPADPGPEPARRPRTPAGSAARSPPTRSPPPRCAPRSSTC